MRELKKNLTGYNKMHFYANKHIKIEKQLMCVAVALLTITSQVTHISFKYLYVLPFPIASIVNALRELINWGRFHYDNNNISFRR